MNVLKKTFIFDCWLCAYSMNRIWWNFNWAEFQWINENFSFGVPSYSVHTVGRNRNMRADKVVSLWLFFDFSIYPPLMAFKTTHFKLIAGHNQWIPVKRISYCQDHRQGFKSDCTSSGLSRFQIDLITEQSQYIWTLQLRNKVKNQRRWDTLDALANNTLTAHLFGRADHRPPDVYKSKENFRFFEFMEEDMGTLFRFDWNSWNFT